MSPQADPFLGAMASGSRLFHISKWGPVLRALLRRQQSGLSSLDIVGEGEKLGGRGVGRSLAPGGDNSP